jgi:hypothetical protein
VVPETSLFNVSHAGKQADWGFSILSVGGQFSEPLQPLREQKERKREKREEKKLMTE